MRHDKLLLIILLLATTMMSCKKSFLDVPVSKRVVAEEYVVNLSTSEEFLNGIYFLLAKDVYNYYNVSYADVSSDNLKDLGGLMNNAYNWAMTPTEYTSGTNMNALWLNSYNVIRSCNFLIERIDEYRQENQVKSDNIKGQLLVIRALLHYNLVNVFAQPYSYTNDGSHSGIPYDTAYNQEKKMIREPVKEVYENIVKDLERAINLLPHSVASPSTVNYIAAKALLSRVYLARKNYSLSNSLAREVISVAFLMPNADYPAKLFTLNDKESIFWLPPALSSNISDTRFLGDVFNSVSYFSATTDLVNIIKEKSSDKRNSWFVLTSGIWQIKKFPIGAIAGISDADRAYFQTVIRTSEIYLIAAETYAQAANEDSARYFLDIIRKRADVSATPIIATGPALLDSIYKERRKELCFENFRMYDLLRLGKTINRVDAVSSSPTYLPYPSDKAIAPIPMPDIRAYGWTQNPGYN